MSRRRQIPVERWCAKPCEIPELAGHTTTGYYSKTKYIAQWHFFLKSTAERFCKLRNEGCTEFEAMCDILTRIRK